MKKNIGTMFITMGLAVVLLVSGYKVLDRYEEAKRSEDSFKVYQQLLNGYVHEEIQLPLEVQNHDPEDKNTDLHHFDGLLEINEDLVGWITIKGTKINYPVLQSKEDPDFYLNHGLDQKKNSHGVPYVDYRTTVDKSTNTIIYGHQMKNGTMFAGLNKFLEESFYEDHPTIRFNTLQGPGEYEIIAVFKTSNLVGVGFDYYNFIEATDEDEFNYFLDRVKALAIYDTLSTAHYGDQLLTLSTCEYTLEEGRLVVVAKKIKAP